jgi:hypothetical protein
LSKDWADVYINDEIDDEIYSSLNVITIKQGKIKDKVAYNDFTDYVKEEYSNNNVSIELENVSFFENKLGRCACVNFFKLSELGKKMAEAILRKKCFEKFSDDSDI